MNYKDMLKLVFDKAVAVAAKGPGFSSQIIALREVMNSLPNRTGVATEQLVLTCWHDLFSMGYLSWGLSIDNPSAPFFHVPVADPTRSRGREPLSGNPSTSGIGRDPGPSRFASEVPASQLS